MAKASAAVIDKETDNSEPVVVVSDENRSASVDVTDPKIASALAAAWRGVHEFFGGKVDQWIVNSPTADEPEGSLSAMGFSVDDDLDPERILADIASRERRLSFQPFYSYLNGEEPVPFTDPAEMTAWSILYLKGSVESGTSKTPEYARNKIAQYKTDQGLKSRRGPKRKVIRLDDLGSLDINELPQDQLQSLLELAQRIAAAQTATAAK